MKTIQLLIFICCTLLLHSQSILLEENFNFSGYLIENGWTRYYSMALNDTISTTSGLEYNNYALSGIGNAANLNSTGEDVYRTFFPQSGNNKTIYFSFMVNVTDTRSNQGDSYSIHLGKTPATGNFVDYCAKVHMRIISGNLNFGIRNGTESINWDTLNYSKDTTYLVIVKYVINSSGNDEASLWIRYSGVPISEIDAGTPNAFTNSGIGQDSVDAICLRQSTATVKVVIDGIRVSNNWGFITDIKDQLSSNKPIKFKLCENYPNPFNPSTTIKWQLPERAFVTLIIYDVLGNEQLTLVKEELIAGEHQIVFNALGFSSGIYFYQIKAGDYTVTKKMVLLK